MADFSQDNIAKPAKDVVFKTKSKHKSLFAFLHREKTALRRSPRLQNKENEAVVLKHHSSLQDLKFKSNKGSKKSENKIESHEPVIKQQMKLPCVREQKSLKRMRSSSISLQNMETAKPAKRRACDLSETLPVTHEQVYPTNTLNRRSFRTNIQKVVSFASRFSPKLITESRETLNQTHSGDFARPMVSPAHGFVRQGSKKYKQLPTPVRRRPSKLWVETVRHSITDVQTRFSPIQIKRQEAIFELYTGEDDMIEDLQLLQEVYYNPMSTLRLIEDQQLKQLFGFISVILPIHKDLSARLRRLKDNQDMIDHVGPVLLDWVSTLRPYVNYCAQQVIAKETLDQLLKGDSGVADFLQRCRESPFSRKLDLWSFIDAPRSRLVKYPLLFNAIKKLTPKEHPDRLLIERAIFEIERIIADADSETGRCKCEHIRNRLFFLDPQHASFVNQASTLSCSGVLRNKNGSKLHVFLFDNLLLMSRPATRQGRMLYQVSHQPIDVSTLSVEDLPDGEAKIGGSFKNTLTKSQSMDKHLFRLCIDGLPQRRTLTFQAHDDHDKKQWIKTFNSVLRDQQQDSVKTKIAFDSMSLV